MLQVNFNGDVPLKKVLFSAKVTIIGPQIATSAPCFCLSNPNGLLYTLLVIHTVTFYVHDTLAGIQMLFIHSLLSSHINLYVVV